MTTTSKYSPSAMRFGSAARRVVLDRHLVAGPLLELGHQLQRHRLEGAGGQQFQIGRGGAAEAGEEAEDGKDDTHGRILRWACP